jgi:hypothetical protein
MVRKWLIGTSVVLATAFFVLRLEYALDGQLLAAPVDLQPHRGLDVSSLFSQAELGPLRLLNFAAFGVVLYWICGKIRWSEVDLRGFRWLALLGRHSLPVFAWSVLMTYALAALFPLTANHTLGAVTVVLATAPGAGSRHDLTTPAKAASSARANGLE